MNTRIRTNDNLAGRASTGNAAEFEALLRSGMDDLMAKTTIHQEGWGFGREQQWLLDEGSAEVIFTFPEWVVSAPAQVIGTWDQETGIWIWAWDDPSVPSNLQEDACRLRDYGIQHAFQHLVSGTWPAEESHCWYMTALACWLCEAKGAYCGATDTKRTFLTFRDPVSNPVPEPRHAPDVEAVVTLAVEEFKHCSAEPAAQRDACCRYLRRGALEGIDQSELIHRLGLVSPSVLDLAGYPQDSAQNVMEILKTITDEEIENCLQ